MPDLKPLAQKMRRTPTDAEKKLWTHLKSRRILDLKFRRQQIIENYIVDFICFERRLIIEVDGGQHTDNAADQERTDRLESKGFLVLRFWNNDVLKNIEGVLQEIINTVNPHPDLPPQGEGGA